MSTVRGWSRASELANTNQICHVGFNTRTIRILKIYAQMNLWMTRDRLSTVGPEE